MEGTNTSCDRDKGHQTTQKPSRGLKRPHSAFSSDTKRTDFRPTPSRQQGSSRHTQGTRREMNDIIYSTSRDRPVHTGVYRLPLLGRWSTNGSPRTYGGIPHAQNLEVIMPTIAPYIRGYSRGDGPSRFLATVVPIQARVFLQFARRERIVHRCPRASGAIPERGGTHTEARQLSPRLRGCSDIRHQRTAETEVLPVHAGVFRFCCLHTVTCRGCPRTYGGTPVSENGSPLIPRLAPYLRGYS